MVSSTFTTVACKVDLDAPILIDLDPLYDQHLPARPKRGHSPVCSPEVYEGLDACAVVVEARPRGITWPVFPRTWRPSESTTDPKQIDRMRYVAFTVAALTALTAALPMAGPEAQLVDTTPDGTIEVGKPSTGVTWGKRDIVDVKPGSTVELGKPSTEVTWGRRDITDVTPGSTVELGKPSTGVSWGKRDLVVTEPGATIELGKPSTEVTWGKE
ncbi:hypothetical protein OPT61_g10355 [Boeremia exigua]|uniref:Uncharacterized protein n=1 Tax=Boeremia exigua TaxID=749465 RepID=A0ACC2HQA8_9PLEO|nr:hypothetical protein OPT61_g10355 [Boeremia exigua]